MVEGTALRKRRRDTCDLYDEYDPATKMTSMARTTGFPCVIVARKLAVDSLRMPGVQPPETLGMQGMLPAVTSAWAERGIVVRHKQEDLPW